MNTSGSKTSAKAATPAKVKGIRQSMSDLHIWTGLLAGWLLYAMFLTGTVSYFREEISQYTRPELPTVQALPSADLIAQRVATHILAQAPKTTQLSITLPTPRNPAVTAFWRNPPGDGSRFSNGMFNASTGQALDARASRGGDFFYAFHFNFHYMSPIWGRWLAGMCAMFMLVAIVSGVITHKKIFADFFTFRWGKGQRSWLDGHAALSVLGLPFHFMITWSGLVTLMVMYMPWGLQTLERAEQAAVTSEMRLFMPAGQPAGKEATLLPLADFVQQAEQRWGAGSVGTVQINHAGDAQARVIVAKQQARRLSTTPHYLVFDGSSGRLLQAKEASGAAANTQGTLYGLHLGRYADPVMRWLYFLVSLAGTAMVGSGLVLWTVKRRAKLANPLKPYFGFALVERLNIAAIAGLSVAMTAFFWCNRLLPLNLDNRAEWEIHGFFIVWLGTLAWALVRPAKRAWVELLALAAMLMALLPLLNALSTKRPLWHSLSAGDWVFAGFELTILVFAALHAHLAWRTHRYRPKAKPVRKAAPGEVA